jgi:hypothetical protein
LDLFVHADMIRYNIKTLYGTIIYLVSTLHATIIIAIMVIVINEYESNKCKYVYTR